MRVIKELLKDSLISNYENIRKAFPNVKKIYAVVKAEAYGNGVKEVVNALKDYEEVHFVVANALEARDVKELVSKKEILLVGGVNKSDFKEILDNDYILGVSTREEIEEISKFINELKNADSNFEKSKMQVHLKINIGMSRLGFDVFENEKFKEEIKDIFKNKNINVKGIYSHLSETDNQEILKLEEERFDKAIELIKETLEKLNMSEKTNDLTIHLLASSGILNGEIKAYDAIRPGIALYGYYSSFDLKEKWEEQHGKLKPTVRIKSRLNLVRAIQSLHCRIMFFSWD